MGGKLTNALQWFWFCLLLFLIKNHLSYPITESLSIQTPWLSNPLFLHCPWSLFHSALSAAYDLGSLNLMTNRYKVHVFKYYYFVFVLADFFFQRKGKSTDLTHNFCSKYRRLQLPNSRTAKKYLPQLTWHFYPLTHSLFFTVGIGEGKKIFFLICSPRSISSMVINTLNINSEVTYSRSFIPNCELGIVSTYQVLHQRDTFWQAMLSKKIGLAV